MSWQASHRHSQDWRIGSFQRAAVALGRDDERRKAFGREHPGVPALRYDRHSVPMVPPPARRGVSSQTN